MYSQLNVEGKRKKKLILMKKRVEKWLLEGGKCERRERMEGRGYWV